MTSFFFFFFNDTATTEIYTLSLHDALPIYVQRGLVEQERLGQRPELPLERADGDRKSTRLNSSHGYISYAVFCLKKKKNTLHCLLFHMISTVAHAVQCRRREALCVTRITAC